MTKEELESISLEEGFTKIEELTKDLSKENISLDESFRLYKEGVELLKFCKDKLESVEKQVLVLNENGELEEFK